MATLVTRSTAQTDGTAAKGSELTHAEVDANFINLNDDKIEASSTDTLTNKSGNISQWTNDSGYITSYTETDTLDSVTGRGATTTNNVSVGQVTATNAVLEGTEDPILTLRSTDDGPLYMEFERGTDRHAYLGFGGSGDTFKIWNEESAGLIQFGTNNTEAIRIDENQDTTFYGKVELSNGASFEVGGSAQHTDFLGGSSDGSSDDGTFAFYGGRTFNAGAGVIITGDDHATNPNVIKFTNGAFVERMRLDASGNLGIGTASPSRLLDVENSGGAAFASIVSSTSDNAALLLGDTDNDALGRVEYENANDAMKLYTAGSTRLTINSSGTVDFTNDVFTTGDFVAGKGSGSIALTINDGYGNSNIAFNHQNGTPDQDGNAVRLEVNTDVTSGAYLDFEGKSNVTQGVAVGLNAMARMYADSGDFHAEGNVIAYSTSISDERLKENVEQVTGALDMLDQIRGVTFDRKDTGKKSAGVIAQELEQVMPYAIYETALPLKTGSEDDIYKLVEYDALHAVLIEAIKELRAEVEALRASSN